MTVINQGQSPDPVELVFSRVDIPERAVLGVVLPTNAGVNVRGLSPAKLSLAENDLGLAREMKLSAGAFYRITDSRRAVVRLPIPRGATWRIGVAYDPGQLKEGETARWSVIARQGGTVLGGNTYYIRPGPRNARRLRLPVSHSGPTGR